MILPAQKILSFGSPSPVPDPPQDVFLIKATGAMKVKELKAAIAKERRAALFATGNGGNMSCSLYGEGSPQYHEKRLHIAHFPYGI